MNKLYLTVLVVFFSLFFSSSWTQKNNATLKNAVVIGQFDKAEDRFTIESTITRLLVDHQINATPALNYVKVGEDATLLATDSMQALFSQRGYDTYIVVSVRGYDRKYKPSTSMLSLSQKLEQGTLREIFLNGSVSVTFEFVFFQNQQQVSIKHIRCTNISDKATVIKRLTKKMERVLGKGWKIRS